MTLLASPLSDFLTQSLAPWWAVPAGVIVGGLGGAGLGLLSAKFSDRRKFRHEMNLLIRQSVAEFLARVAEYDRMLDGWKTYVNDFRKNVGDLPKAPIKAAEIMRSARAQHEKMTQEFEAESHAMSRALESLYLTAPTQCTSVANDLVQLMLAQTRFLNRQFEVTSSYPPAMKNGPSDRDWNDEYSTARAKLVKAVRNEFGL